MKYFPATKRMNISLRINIFIFALQIVETFQKMQKYLDRGEEIWICTNTSESEVSQSKWGEGLLWGNAQCSNDVKMA